MQNDREAKQPPLANGNPHARGAAAPLLGLSNPARLSRTEFRLCLLLSQGLHADRVADAMGIAPATLRAHLRRIFVKTGAASLSDLAERLAAEAAAGPAIEAAGDAPRRPY